MRAVLHLQPPYALSSSLAPPAQGPSHPKKQTPRRYLPFQTVTKR